MNQGKVSKLLLKIRKKNHLTQKEMADKFGVTYQAVSKWENGKNIPDISTLKQICDTYKIDINDVLSGKKSHKKVIFIICIIIIVLGIILYATLHKDNFEFKTLSTTCETFTISGSIAYNNNKSSIYISDINYCGGDDNLIYKSVVSTLYETSGNKTIKIAESTKKNNITLENYLKNVKYNVNDYKSSCIDFKSNNLFIEINATNSNNIINTYKIPLKLNENCLN